MTDRKITDLIAPPQRLYWHDEKASGIYGDEGIHPFMACPRERDGRHCGACLVSGNPCCYCGYRERD